MLGRRLKRALVEADLGVGQVLVVHQHEIGHSLASQVGDRRAFVRDVEFDPPAELQGLGLAIVEAHGKAMRPDRRVLGWRFLLDGQGTDRVALGDGKRSQGVQARGLQPDL